MYMATGGLGERERRLLRRGIDLFNEGHYWHAHEAWEDAWTPDRYGPDRGFWKGLIQIAAGCLHCTRHNARGARSKWTGGTGYLRPYVPRHHGVELAPLVQRVEELLEAIESDPWPAPDELPRIEVGPSPSPGRAGSGARRPPR
jgi:predicted metal-dependent hydrolase